MANEEQLAILQQGVDVWNRWREEQQNVELDLQKTRLGGVDLQGANFRGADFSRANLRDVNLQGVDLYGVNLQGTDLYKANLHKADLRKVILHKADLQEANLIGANFTRADLTGADLRDANLRLSILRQAVLTETNMREAKCRSSKKLAPRSAITHECVCAPTARSRTETRQARREYSSLIVSAAVVLWLSSMSDTLDLPTQAATIIAHTRLASSSLTTLNSSV